MRIFERTTIDQIPQAPHVGVLLFRGAEVSDQPPRLAYLVFANVGDFRLWESRSLKEGSLREGTYRASHNGAHLAAAAPIPAPDFA